MKDSLRLEFVERPEESAWGIIGRGVHEFNQEHAGDEGFERLCFVLRDEAGAVVGGAIGELFWGWFHLDLLWVQPELRGRGHGSRLLTRIEDEARKRGAGHVFLDTFSFQAPEFYERRGYRQFGELQDFPPGHRRHFMRKDLVSVDSL